MTDEERREYAQRQQRHIALQAMLMERMDVRDDAAMLSWAHEHGGRFRAILMGDTELRDACESGAVDQASARLFAQWERFKDDGSLSELLAQGAHDAAMEYVRQQVERPLH